MGDLENLLFVLVKNRKLSTWMDYEKGKKGLNVLKKIKSSFRYSPFFFGSGMNIEVTLAYA